MWRIQSGRVECGMFCRRVETGVWCSAGWSDMGFLFGSHWNLGLVKPVNMTIVIRTIRRGEYWVIDGNLGYITTDGVEKPVKDQEE